MDYDYTDYDDYSYKSYLWMEDGRFDYPAKPEKRRFSRKKDVWGTVAVLAILICFAATLFATDYLSGENMLAFWSDDTRAERVYYMVSTQSAALSPELEAASMTIKGQGGAGYVYKDDKYYLIAAAYSDRADAEKIAGGISGGSVLTVTADAPSLKWCPLTKRERLKDVLGYADEVYAGLYALSAELDGGLCSEQEAKDKIASLYSKTENIKAEFDSLKLNENLPETVKIKMEITTAAALLKVLENGGFGGYPLVSDVRYCYCVVLVNYCRLLKDI